jgi:hypothetical protein
VDVPFEISEQLKKEKGYIRIKGLINDFKFIQTLVPVKDRPHRLYVNGLMMKGGNTALDKTASFVIEQNTKQIEKEYPVPSVLKKELTKHGLTANFKALSPTRIKDILKYLSYIKTEETLLKHITKVIIQLANKEKNVKIP